MVHISSGTFGKIDWKGMSVRYDVERQMGHFFAIARFLERLCAFVAVLSLSFNGLGEGLHWRFGKP